MYRALLTGELLTEVYCNISTVKSQFKAQNIFRWTYASDNAPIVYQPHDLEVCLKIYTKHHAYSKVSL